MGWRVLPHSDVMLVQVFLRIWNVLDTNGRPILHLCLQKYQGCQHIWNRQVWQVQLLIWKIDPCNRKPRNLKFFSDNYLLESKLKSFLYQSCRDNVSTSNYEATYTWQKKYTANCNTCKETIVSPKTIVHIIEIFIRQQYAWFMKNIKFKAEFIKSVS